MELRLKSAHLVAIPQTELEGIDLAEWKFAHRGHVFLLSADDGDGLALRDLGPQPVACREPINVTSRHPDEVIRLISNFAVTPFELNGQAYDSVEGFWQGLKFDEPAERRRLAAADPRLAKRDGQHRGYGDFVAWQGEAVRVGSPAHWRLMRLACQAKFTQHAAAGAALVGTAPRPLEHRVRRDSVAIPGVIMADIWMRVREELMSAR
jgi:predicted NAD-dependent protein-ADP-ribosyltransferase YbiA (DUF1768 family)